MRKQPEPYWTSLGEQPSRTGINTGPPTEKRRESYDPLSIVPKHSSLIRSIVTFFLTVVICFSCSKPKVTTPYTPTDQPALPGQSNALAPEYNIPRPQPKIDRTTPGSRQRQTIVQTAMTAVGKPYRWGGLSLTGFDCSGLVVYTYAKIGIHVPRTAKAQFKNCTSVTRKNIKPADLVFFSVPRKRRVVHVGIYIGKGQFIHAPGRGRKVKFASLDNVYFKQHFIRAGNFFKKMPDNSCIKKTL